jgi:outer membrane biosynthesis protein TonB
LFQELLKGWQRFWALSWWWKGSTLVVTAFIVLIAGIAVASGGSDNDTEGREPATTVTPTSIPTVMPTEIPTSEPTPTPSPTRESIPTLEPTQPPAPTPAPTTPPASEPTPPPPDCDPSYPDFCIRSPPPELDCGGIVFGNFTVLPPDPHGFDEDKDGIGCE